MGSISHRSREIRLQRVIFPLFQGKKKFFKHLSHCGNVSYDHRNWSEAEQNIPDYFPFGPNTSTTALLRAFDVL
jgi:hypothetical protein